MQHGQGSGFRVRCPFGFPPHPHQSLRTSDRSCMLTRHIAKTALPHLTCSRVICNHHHLRSLHHTPSRHITTPTQIVEPTLNWRPGIDSESQIEPLKRGRGRPRKHPVPEEDTAKRGRGRPRKHPVSEEEDTAKLGRRPRKPPGTEDVRVKPQGEYPEETPGIEQGYLPRRRPVIEEPVLNWVSGHRTRDIHKAIQSSGPDLGDLEDPKLHWLASHREGHEPRPAWQGSIRGRLDADPVTLLKLASLELTRRRRIRIAEPEKNPITRYPLFEKRPTSGKKLARKVISNIRNASDHLNLSEPVITVGTARWTAENPRRVPEARLRVESLEELFGRGDNHQQEETMDGSSVDASEITMAMEEPVPNDTNIEMPSPNDAPTGATSAPEAASNPDLKRIHDSSSSKVEGGPNKKKRVAKRKPMKEGGAEEVLGYDIKSLLATFNITEKDIAPGILPEYQSTLELTIADISSSGDGLAVHNNRVYCVPYTLPGDKVEAIVKNHQESHTMAELIKVITPSPDRDDSLINCKYFAACSGCQFQMLPYEKQLEQKRRTVQKAFANFSDLPAELIPDVLPTMGSPLQYGYRTKLTPHFNGPRRGGFKPGFPPPNIGFMSKMGKYTIDIEDCPIGTDAVREGLKIQREWVKNNLHTYKRGATLLLRESTNRVPIEGPVENDGEKYVETKKYITNSNQRSIEYFGDFRFNSPAGSFFQNNNSILESVCIDNTYSPSTVIQKLWVQYCNQILINNANSICIPAPRVLRAAVTTIC